MSSSPQNPTMEVDDVPESAPSPGGAPSPAAAPSPEADPEPAPEAAPSPTTELPAEDTAPVSTAVFTTAEEGGEGEYVPATENSAARIPSFKKRRGSGDAEEEDDDDDDEERERRRKKKKEARAERRARAAAEEEEEEEQGEQVDEATARRRALEERIDAVGKTNRAPRRKKKREDIDIVEGYHDDVCVRLRDRMYSAAEADQKANQRRMPATSKLAMLEEVVSALQNTTLWSSIIDNEVLKAVKVWLEPLPDKSLPAVGIQKAIFEVLPKMDLDTATIREAGLGPIVLFYTKTKRVTPNITRQADALVQTWSRPIIKRPADFRSRHIATVDEIERPEYEEEERYDEDGEPRDIRPRPKTKTKTQRFNAAEATLENRDRKGARLPSVRDVQYTVAPESRLTHRSGETGYIARIQQDNRKFNSFARKLKGPKASR